MADYSNRCDYPTVGGVIPQQIGCKNDGFGGAFCRSTPGRLDGVAPLCSATRRSLSSGRVHCLHASEVPEIEVDRGLTEC